MASVVLTRNRRTRLGAWVGPGARRGPASGGDWCTVTRTLQLVAWVAVAAVPVGVLARVLSSSPAFRGAVGRGRVRAGLGALVASVGLAVSATPASALIYWTNFGGTIPESSTLGRANLDGTGVDQSFITGTSTSRLYGVAVAGQHIYWGDFVANGIGRANLDGTGVDQSFITGTNGPYALAVDGQHIYWSNYSGGTIGRANLDGTGVDQSFITGAGTPAGVTVDGQHIYWTNQGGTIGRANLDGTGVDHSFIVGANAPSGVAVDGQHIYWSNYFGTTIGRANLDGTSVDQSFIVGANGPVGVAVDGQHVYWANFGPDAISGGGTALGRANLDGSAVDQSFISGADNPVGVAVDTLGPPLSTAPVVSGVSPSQGPAAGGTAVTITGSNFTGASAVSFGGTPAASFTVASAAAITATTPAGSGTEDVTVTTARGTSATGSAGRYTFVPAPTITGISPSSGPAAGGTSVTIAGTNLSGAVAVSFGASAAASFVVNSATQITTTSPAGTGTVNVTATTTGGTSATGSADQYTYVSAPTVTGISPASGPASGGTSVEITGAELSGASAVKFGTTAATAFTVQSSTRIVVVAPAGSGTVDVTVTTPGGTSAKSAANRYTYVPPPVVAKRTTAAPVSGAVLVKPPGANQYVDLRSLTSIPMGTTIDTTKGRVRITAASGRGRTQSTEFYSGVFIVTQAKSGLVDATLSGDLSGCSRPGGRRSARHAKAKPKPRRLWGHGSGSFRTRGRFGSATVIGTRWLTEDRCDGTFFKVSEGRVLIADFRRHKTLLLRAPHSYLVRKP